MSSLPDIWNKSVFVKIMSNVICFHSHIRNHPPSYQHFLQYIQEKGFSRFSITSESELLVKYGKTITMIVLARVNGYFPPYFPQTIMEEEAKCLYCTNFSFAERDFFTNKLLKITPNMSQEAINQSIAFLERQKEANCPCTIHTQKRGYDWIVFNRLPDNTFHL